MKPIKQTDTNSSLPELTLRGVLLASLMTIIFTASNIYLGLKVGLTFATSIPAAIISMALLSSLGKSNILENNMVQTQASIAGALASIVFALPALVMIGYWHNFAFWETTLITLAGGMLGVVFSVPLRHALVVKSKLPYPEGLAAAEVLRVGDAIRLDKKANKKQPIQADAKEIMLGTGIAATLHFFTEGLRLLSGSCSYWIQTVNGSIFQISTGFSLAMMGAGYLMGVATGVAIFIGFLLAWCVFVPYFTATTPMPIELANDIAGFAMTLWQKKVRLIGAGTISVAAIWVILTLFKPMLEGVRNSFGSLFNNQLITQARTEQNLSPKVILTITLVMFFALIGVFYHFISDLAISQSMFWVLVLSAVILTCIMGLVVSAVCGYMAGLFGSSASPISSIAIIAVVFLSLLLLYFAHSTSLLLTEKGTQFAMALVIFATSTVLTIACVANDNMQDLKTGYLVGATPYRQQISLLIGCAVGSIVIAPVVEMMYQAYGFIGAMPREGMNVANALAAPQAMLMQAIAAGIFTETFQWDMFLIGMALGVVLVIIDMLFKKSGSKLQLPVLAVGIGIYLPPALEMPLVIGGFLSWLTHYLFLKKTFKDEETRSLFNKITTRRGTLLASGFIVGESILGVIIAAIIVMSVSQGGTDTPLSLVPYLGGTAYEPIAQWLGLGLFVAICIGFVKRINKAFEHTK